MITLKISTRPSPLAVKQAEEIQALLPSIKFKLVTIDTAGDRDKNTPLSKMEGTDFFTREIEEALLSGEIDAAIHSAKDLEEILPKDLTIAAMTESISAYDTLVSRHGETLDVLAAGSVVGTSSKKRKEDILRYRKDLTVKDIRGTIGERLSQLYEGAFDAIIVAHAALIRLGYVDWIRHEILPEHIVKPHPLQGRLAVEIRRDRADLLKTFRRIDVDKER